MSLNLFKSAANLFSSPAAAGVVSSGPANSVGQPGQVAQATQAPPVNQVNSPAASAPAVPANESPLDNFKGAWDTGNVKPDIDNFSFGATSEQIQAATSKLNLVDQINPKYFEAIQAGGTQAAQAYQASLNELSQKITATNTEVTTKLVEQALARQQESFLKAIPQLVQRVNSSNELNAANPVFQHPSVAPLVKAAQSSFMAANPNASPGEVSAYVTSAFDALANTIVSAKMSMQPAPKPSARDSDFSNW